MSYPYDLFLMENEENNSLIKSSSSSDIDKDLYANSDEEQGDSSWNFILDGVVDSDTELESELYTSPLGSYGQSFIPEIEIPSKWLKKVNKYIKNGSIDRAKLIQKMTSSHKCKVIDLKSDPLNLSNKVIKKFITIGVYDDAWGTNNFSDCLGIRILLEYNTPDEIDPQFLDYMHYVASEMRNQETFKTWVFYNGGWLYSVLTKL